MQMDACAAAGGESAMNGTHGLLGNLNDGPFDLDPGNIEIGPSEDPRKSFALYVIVERDYVGILIKFYGPSLKLF